MLFGKKKRGEKGSDIMSKTLTYGERYRCRFRLLIKITVLFQVDTLD